MSKELLTPYASNFGGRIARLSTEDMAPGYGRGYAAARDKAAKIAGEADGLIFELSEALADMVSDRNDLSEATVNNARAVLARIKRNDQ